MYERSNCRCSRYLKPCSGLYLNRDLNHTERVTFHHKNIHHHYKRSTASPRPSTSIRSANSYKMDQAPSQFEIDDILEIFYSDPDTGFEKALAEFKDRRPLGQDSILRCWSSFSSIHNRERIFLLREKRVCSIC